MSQSPYVYDPRVSAVVESDNPALIARSWRLGNEPHASDEGWCKLADYCEELVPAPLCRRERDALEFVAGLAPIVNGAWRVEANKVLSAYGLPTYPLVTSREESADIQKRVDQELRRL